MIPAHWIQQVITSLILEKAKYMPTQAMIVARARVGRCWLFSDHAQEDAHEEEFQEDSVPPWKVS